MKKEVQENEQEVKGPDTCGGKAKPTYSGGDGPGYWSCQNAVWTWIPA